MYSDNDILLMIIFFCEEEAYNRVVPNSLAF
jgi:hypothetical protein